MKCPNCSQEIIDNKEFCPNCGKRLKESKVINPKTVMIVSAVFLLFGLGLYLSIMYLGKEKELEPPFDEKEKPPLDYDDNTVITNREKANVSDIEKYFGNYVITNMITTDNTPEKIMNIKDYILGWSVEFDNTQTKFCISTIEWILIDKPTFYIEDKNKVQSFFDDSSNFISISVTGKDSIFYDEQDLNFIINNDKLYLYRYNSLFELEKDKNNYKKNNNFYKLTLLKNDYMDEINNKISEVNNLIKKDVETPDRLEIIVNSKVHYEGDLVHVYIGETIGPVYAGPTTRLYLYTYDTTSSKFLNLGEYLKYKGKTLDSIRRDFDKAVSNVDLSTDSHILPLSETSVYYVDSGILYIQYINEPLGKLFLQIQL